MIEPNDIPRHHKKANQKRKRFGIERRCLLFKKWHPWKWYLTEEKRDQAFTMLDKHKHTYSYAKYRKVER